MTATTKPDIKSRSPGAQPAANRQTRATVLVLGFHLVLVTLTALYIYVRTLPPTPVPMPRPQHAEAAWWGFWPVTYVPDLLFTSGVILILALLIWLWYVDWSDIAPISAKTSLPPTPAPRPRGLPLWMPVTGALFVVAFYLFPIVHTRWGDAYILSRAISWPDPALRLTHTWQAPLDVALHSWVWQWLHAPLGWEDATPVYYLLSPIAGILYLTGVMGIARDARFAPGWLTFGLLMTLGLLQQFFGYIENYSFIIAGMLIYLWLAIDTLRGERPLWQPALALALTHALHPSTIILAPTLLLCGWFVLQRRHPNAHFPRALFRRAQSGPVLWAIAWPMLLVFGLTVLMMESGGHGLLALLTHDQPGGSDGSWFVPLFETSSRWEHYTMFSWLHLRDYLNEKVLSGPVVVWSLLWLALARSIGWVASFTRPAAPVTHPENDPAADPVADPGERHILRFLVTSSALYLLFVWVWNPDYGGQRDWDLFSPVAVPTTVLLIYLLPRALSTPWRLLMVGAPMILLQLLATAAWIYQNTLPWEWP
ncbi:MAG: hypothetical protein WDZ49_07020 [Litorilinea sp.]